MKKLILLGLIPLMFTLSTCEKKPKKCAYCDIYDENGEWVKDYGKYCGPEEIVEEFAIEADVHAEYYYDGWAECSYTR
jgi:hypothetical protein